ncbi:hypothetical protein HT574_19130 [Parageobacillus sp. VR-IP]|uniref:methyltransferase domain-containing protein n=1 Tax=Parageobacillus sp. VR-IP TaxID=2742205 RepID=UPI0015833A1C|nr:methyltransferase domain-containing protein [Parageobacillus sp. VR-IP]NUK32091.1 hypothetical protein [Parageobacillus sp. VR-IP]
MVVNTLYSISDILINNVDTLMEGKSIFTGTQLDDFALANLKINKKILLLGSGLGGAIRTFLIKSPDSHIYIVDNDLHNLSICENIFKKYFPQINNLHFILNDAKDICNYLQKEKFDVVAVDLYTAEGYPDFTLKSTFWKDIKSLLRIDGMLIVNSFGLPFHLHPLEGESPQKKVVADILKHFNFVSYLPHRRNLTVIATDIDFNPSFTTPNVKLSNQDLSLYNMLHIRWKYRYKIKNRNGIDSNYTSNGSKESLNNEMERRWDNLLSVLNKYNESNFNITSENLSQLLFEKNHIGQNITMELAKRNKAEASFIPIALGSLTFKYPNHFNWYFEWILDKYEEMFYYDSAWTVNTVFWQAFSMIINPFSSGYGKYLTPLVESLNKLVNFTVQKASE